ncbi:PAS domain S-box protein [Mucilaginibacter aquatilis]|nr:PAS domain S-box protein [Mucilaginibacter aquatilis]
MLPEHVLLETIMHSNEAIAIYSSEELHISFASDAMLRIWGKDRDIIGKTFEQAIPEIIGQPFTALLQEAWHTGVTYTATDTPATVKINGVMTTSYFNFEYKAVKDAFGKTVCLLHTATDVTKQIDSQRALKKNEHQLRQLIMTAPMGMCIIKGEDLVVELANKPMLRIWTRSAEEMMGKGLLDVFPELKEQSFPRLLKSVLQTGEPVNISETVAEIAETDGTINTVYIDISYQPLFDLNGVPEAILATVIDITETVRIRQRLEESERKLQDANEELSAINEEQESINEELTSTVEQLVQTESLLQQTNLELTESKDRLQTILDTVAEGIGITDTKGNVIYSNERAQEILKVDRESILKRKNSSPEWSNCHLDGSPMLHEEHPVSVAISSNKPVYNHLFLIQAKDEDPMYINMNASPIRDKSGNITGAIGSFTDATESHQLHLELEQAHRLLSEHDEQLRLAIQSAELGTWYINAETKEFIPSNRLKEMFGYYPDETMPYDAAITQVAEEFRDKVTNAVEAALTKGESYDLEYPIIGFRDKQLRWIKATGRLYPSAKEGQPGHFSGTVADITERKLDEQRKNDFIGIVSHELRSPLTSMSGYVQMLMLKSQKSNDAVINGIASKAKRQIDRMMALISGFLDVARMSEGKIQLKRSCFDMAHLVKLAEEESMATHTSHQIVFHPVEYTPIEADQDKIEQVLVNFINNAVKYSPEGSAINVSCYSTGGKVKVSVSDQGMGISAKDQPHVFDRFYRVESDNMKFTKGFGIGLYICKEIIERHDGKIGVSSELGVGSEFWFELPIDNQ